MSLNFPTTPATGDSYTFGVRTWVWNGYAWDSSGTSGLGSGGGSITGPYVVSVNGATGPLSFVDGSNITISQSGTTFTFNSSGGGGGSGGISFTYGLTAPASPTMGDEWYRPDIASLFTYIDDGSSSQWVELLRGLPGVSGPTGPAGANGVTGPTGPAGSGSTGATGPAGATGPQGNTGATGPAGSGSTGATGPAGPLPSNYVVSINGTTGPLGLTSGSNISITQTGLTFTISAVGGFGATGATGATGARGSTGATGPQGNPGSDGTSGSPGANGVTGATGPTGSQGIQGIQGVTGATGPTGSQGIQGIQGVTGATGPTGSQGIQGIQGVTGATGSRGATGTAGSPGSDGTNGTNGTNGATGPTGPTGSMPSDYVVSINGITGSLSLTSGANVTITQVGLTFTISAASGTGNSSGGITGPYVQSINGTTGTIGLSAGTNISIAQTGLTFTFNSRADFTYGTSPPSGPTNGSMWYDSTNAILFTYVNDGDSYQWVQLVKDIIGPTGPTGPTGVDSSSSTNFRTFSMGAVFDGGGIAPTVNTNTFVRSSVSGTITKASIFADATGNAEVGVWRDTWANYPPTVADSIVASTPPSLIGQIKSEDSTLTGWSKSITAGDVIAFNLNSVSSCTRVTVQLDIVKTP